jgi:hypothetical protein
MTADAMVKSALLPWIFGLKSNAEFYIMKEVLG